MKLSKILAVSAATAVAVSTMAVSSFAALLETTVEESSGPKNNMWELEFTDEVNEWAGKVEKVVATVTSQEYLNGAMGGNTVKADGWAASAQCENAVAGTNEWVWDEIGGLKAGLDEEGNQIGYFKVEFWWQNAITNEDETVSPTTATLDKVVFYGADGAVLAEYPAPEEDLTSEEASSEETPDVGATESSIEESEEETVIGDCTGSTDESSEDENSNKGDDDGNVPTGVALAVVPAALAAAGLVAAGVIVKKRK